jgi:hypothetical protein
VVEDWLLHTSDAARTDLAGFLDGPGHGRLAAAGLAAAIGHNAVVLHHRLKRAHR